VLNKSLQEQEKRQQWLIPLFSFLFAFILSITPAYADNLIVISREADSYHQVADSINQSLNTNYKVITLKELDENSHSIGDYQQIIAVGSRAADQLVTLAPADTPLYVSFIPRQTYSQLLLKYADHQRIKTKKITAIYLDQPYYRQLALAKLVTPSAKSIATALGPHSSNDRKLLQKAAKKLDLELKSVTLAETDNPIHKLQPLIKSADIFLSLPDKSVFNRTTAKWVLYISFRQRIPLIAFSKKYVEAGALAAVYSTPEDIGKQTAEALKYYAVRGRLPDPTYSDFFDVSTNKAAANSLRIVIPPEENLVEQLRGLE
jgi:hypothetical protein